MEVSDLHTHISGVFEHSQGGSTSQEAQEDAENRFWSEYLKAVEDYDTRLTDKWRADSDGVLVFAGLLSATIGIFIIESYKLLSPSSGDRTVVLLEQISQQFSDFANGRPVQPQPPPAPAYTPSASIVGVNCVWLLSLMLSTTAALFATLTQQCSHTYYNLPQTLSVPSKRARVRSFLFLGTVRYYMDHANRTAPTLINLSMLLFHVGLVIFFFPINESVALVVLASVALFGVTYFLLTILPCFDHTCPYRTPLSSLAWYQWHALALVAKLFFQGISRQLRALFNSFSQSDVQSRGQSRFIKWLDSIQLDLAGHKQRLTNGFRANIVNYALQAPRDVDVNALTWLFQLPALADKSKFERLVAAIPGETIVRLLNISTLPDHGKITFLEHLSALLRSCAPGTVGLDEGMRRLRLSACLDAIHHIARASIIPYYGVLLTPSLLSDVRTNFANMNLMRALWANKHPAIRVTARSVCALLAKHLLHKCPLERLDESELTWLGEVMGRPPLNDLAAADSRNIDSFVYGILSHQTEELPIIQATTFADTLAILMTSEGPNVHPGETFAGQLSSLILRIEQGEHEDRDNIVDKLNRMFRGILPADGQHPEASNT